MWPSSPSPPRGSSCRRTLTAALASELLGTLSIVGAGVALSFVGPYKSLPILERDPALSHPLVSPPTVSVGLLVVLGGVVPGAVIGLILTVAAVTQRAGFSALMRSGFAHFAMLLQALLLAMVWTDAIKVFACYPRPNFLCVCVCGVGAWVRRGVCASVMEEASSLPCAPPPPVCLGYGRSQLSILYHHHLPLPVTAAPSATMPATAMRLRRETSRPTTLPLLQAR